MTKRQIQLQAKVIVRAIDEAHGHDVQEPLELQELLLNIRSALHECADYQDLTLPELATATAALEAVQ